MGRLRTALDLIGSAQYALARASPDCAATRRFLCAVRFDGELSGPLAMALASSLRWPKRRIGSLDKILDKWLGISGSSSSSALALVESDIWVADLGWLMESHSRKMWCSP